MFHLRPGSSDLGLVASNAFHYFFKLAADRRLRMAGLFPNRDFQISKLFARVETETSDAKSAKIPARQSGKHIAPTVRAE
jgi:hypothetical protein